MIPNCKIQKKENITVIIPQTGVNKIHSFEFDEVFYQDLTKSKKKICVFRNFQKYYLPNLEDFCKPFDIVFLEKECFDFIPNLDPNKFILITDLSNQVIDFCNVHSNIEFVPFYWYRTSSNYANVNKKLWTKSKKYFLTTRMNNPRPWKIDLLSNLVSFKYLEWSSLQPHEKIPNSPRFFESEKNLGINHELPSYEQILSYALLCLETNNFDITEKTYQHLYHLSPTVWHTSDAILHLEQFGLTVRFNGFDYSYLSLPREDKIRTLVQQIKSMDQNDYKDFYHQNVRETQNNHDIMKSTKNWYDFFAPKVKKYL